MEFIPINDEKLKIILSEEDLNKFKISAEALDYSERPTKELLKSVLMRAKEETGFDPDGSELYVQVFTSGNGSCEIYVSKVQEHMNRKNTSCTKQECFIILRFEELINLCNRLVNDGYILDSSLYCVEKGKYIFIPGGSCSIALRGNELHETRIPDYISEYGEVKRLQTNTPDYFNEYFTLIAKGDVARLISLI